MILSTAKVLPRNSTVVLIRRSSCSNVSEEFTIFTITHSYIRNGTKFINNMRYLTIHGIGVYNVSHYNKRYFENLTKKM